MLRANSKINKIGTFEEPANPNSSINFFKAAKDWSRLSGYVSNLSPNKKNSNLPESSHPTPTNRIELSHESHEQKVQTALSYLFLRDLGCSREEAMFLTNRRKADQGEFVTSLSPTLKKGFKQKMKKSRCLPCRPDLVDEEFESISKAFKNLIIRKQVLYDSAFPEQEKYEKKVKSELKKLKKYRKEDCLTPEPLVHRTEKLDNKLRDAQSQCARRIIVPDVPVVKSYVSVTPNVLGIEEISTVASPVSRLLDYSGVKLEEPEGKKEDFKMGKVYSGSMSPKGSEYNIRSAKRKHIYKELLAETCLFNQQTPHNPSSPLPSSSTPNPGLNPSQQSKTQRLLSPPSKSIHSPHPPKLIDLLLIQKLKTGQINAKKSSEKQKQAKLRKNLLEAKQYHTTLSNFHQKQQRIQKILTTKQNPLITRVKSPV